MDIAEFLLARIAEDESSSPNVHVTGCWSTHWEHDRLGYDVKDCNCDIPTRIRTECAAKRALIEEHGIENVPVLEVRGEVVMSGPQCRKCADWDNEGMDGPPNDPAPCRTLRLLARPYTDHPDFDPAWRV